MSIWGHRRRDKLEFSPQVHEIDDFLIAVHGGQSIDENNIVENNMLAEVTMDNAGQLQ